MTNYKIRKGDLVELDEELCRKRHSNYEGIVHVALRPTTPEEQNAWYDTEAAKGMNDAGESKLPPQSAAVKLKFGQAYEVVRARCRIRLNWGRPWPHMAALQCMHTGHVGYIKRELIKPYGIDKE